MHDVSYSSARGAIRRLKERGGLLKGVGDAMDRLGFNRTENPEHGDIGIISASNVREHVAGAAVVIFDGVWWIGKELNGYSQVKIEGVPAWRVC